MVTFQPEDGHHAARSDGLDEGPTAVKVHALMVQRGGAPAKDGAALYGASGMAQVSRSAVAILRCPDRSCFTFWRTYVIDPVQPTRSAITTAGNSGVVPTACTPAPRIGVS
jgi:hypothetical protein